MLALSILSIVAPWGASSSPGAALVALLFTGVIVLCVSVGIVTASDITLEDEGIRLRLFGLWHWLVPWHALREMTIRAVDEFPMYGSRWELRKRKIARVFFAIHVPGLTFLHLLTGLFYGLGVYPVFLITPDHRRHEALLERLREAAIQQGCDPERL